MIFNKFIFLIKHKPSLLRDPEKLGSKYYRLNSNRYVEDLKAIPIFRR